MTYPIRNGCELGVDVSRWQSMQRPIDWVRLNREASVTWAVAKATEGDTWVDPSFKTNSENAPAADVAFGSYHYFQPARDPVAQAVLYSDTAERASLILPALDFETLKGCTIRDAVARARIWISEVADVWGEAPLFYSYPGFISQLVNGIRDANGVLLDEGDPEGMAAIASVCPLWIAHYTPKPKPWIPLPWNDWVAWQFDGDKGLVLPWGVDSDFNWCPDLARITRKDAMAMIVPGDLVDESGNLCP
jgi:lysozyme